MSFTLLIATFTSKFTSSASTTAIGVKDVTTISTDGAHKANHHGKSQKILELHCFCFC
jgi:hypothetical protein